MKKYKLLIIILIIIAVLGLIVALGQLNKKPAMILFYGDGCPHCEIVDEYIANNNVKDKYQFQKLEIFNNKQNAQLMAQKTRQCGLDTSQGMGVPFFFDGQNCYLGDQDIINFFSK